jgi:flagellar hook-associated protein 1 FlgK
VIFKANNGTMKLTGGQLGGLASAQQEISGTIDNVDSLAGNLIFELNKLHASGQGLEGLTSTTATNALDDTTVPLNDPKSGLKEVPNNGSFVVHVTNKTTGLTTSTLVQVDLDGQNANDTTLDSLTADLNGIANVNASVSGGKLKIATSSSDVEVSFSQDSSGVLAALGINNFYQGTNASDIAVNSAIQADPKLLAAAKNGEPADNQTALAIANHESVPRRLRTAIKTW